MNPTAPALAPIDTDVVVIGAGPVGLFAVFQLGLLGLRSELIDVLPEPGGQCVALYPDKPIYDIPGIRQCTGRELTQQLLAQCQPFLRSGPGADQAPGMPTNLHLGQQVLSLAVNNHPPDARRFHLGTDAGQHFSAQAVFIAAGAGAFVPRHLPIPGMDKHLRLANVHHHLHHDPSAPALPAPWAGQHLVVAGGGDEALQSVVDVLAAPAAQQPARISLLHRRDHFQADAALEAQVRQLIAQGRVHLVLGMPQGADLSDLAHPPGGAASSGDTANAPAPRLTTLHLLGPDGQTQAQPLDHLLVRLGLSPQLGPLLDWGLALERKQVAVDAATFATSVEGIHAVGDINTYPGKKRLLLCGFHEATLAAHATAARLRPQDPQHLQYTTTSALLHQRLGLIP